MPPMLSKPKEKNPTMTNSINDGTQNLEHQKQAMNQNNPKNMTPTKQESTALIVNKWRVDFRVNASQGQFDTCKAFRSFANAIFERTNAQIHFLQINGKTAIESKDTMPDNTKPFYTFHQGTRKEHGSYKYSMIVRIAIGNNTHFQEIKRQMMAYLTDKAVNAYLSEHPFTGNEVVSEGFLIFRNPDICNLDFQKDVMFDMMIEVLENVDISSLTKEQEAAVTPYISDEAELLPEFELQKVKVRAYLPKEDNEKLAFAETHTWWSFDANRVMDNSSE